MTRTRVFRRGMPSDFDECGSRSCSADCAAHLATYSRLLRELVVGVGPFEHSDAGLAVPGVARKRLLQFEPTADFLRHHHASRCQGRPLDRDRFIAGLQHHGCVVTTRHELPNEWRSYDARRCQIAVAVEHVTLVVGLLAILAGRIRETREAATTREERRWPRVAPEGREPADALPPNA